jgi:hypothetical protein
MILASILVLVVASSPVMGAAFSVQENSSPAPTAGSASAQKSSQTSGDARQQPGEGPSSESHPTQKNCRVNQRIGSCSAPSKSSGKPRKIVVREGSTIEPKVQLAPGLTPEQADEQRGKAAQLLNATENNLYQLAGRSLDQSQQDTVAHIRNYMANARFALQEGDPQRARNLALKAQLLSADLAGQ